MNRSPARDALSWPAPPAAAVAGPLDKTECIAPAKPGGGFDLTCKLAQSALMEGKFIADPMRITYMPGGIGAVAYNAIVAQRPAEANTIVAFSGGSLLNLAQGKFGRYNENDVRWLAAVGSRLRRRHRRRELAVQVDEGPGGRGQGRPDQGRVRRRRHRRQPGLDEGRADRARRRRRTRSRCASSPSKAAARRSPRCRAATCRSTPATRPKPSEQIKAGAKIRVLAVMADKRLPGSLAAVPTAKEQGFDIEWPIIRGFYLGPKVSDADYKVWADTFAQDDGHAGVRQAARRARPVPVRQDRRRARRLRQAAASPTTASWPRTSASTSPPPSSRRPQRAGRRSRWRGHLKRRHP